MDVELSSEAYKALEGELLEELVDAFTSALIRAEAASIKHGMGPLPASLYGKMTLKIK